jgi:hypothetical protein
MEVEQMASRKDDESTLEQGKRDTQIRRDTQVRGSMGVPPSGNASEAEKEGMREEIRGSEHSGTRPLRKPGEMPRPD